MKKISIGFNSFPSTENRFKVARESYELLNDIFPEVEIIDIQRVGSTGLFKTIDGLKRTSLDSVIGSTKDLPFVNDLFSIMADLDTEYFIVTNADVMISPRLIKYILDTEIVAMPCSRLDVLPIEHINQFMTPVRWEIGGFDTFCFKTDWYKSHHWLFEDFLLGKPWYDHHYAGLMKIFGNNDSIGNKYPAFCLHEHHGFDSCIPNTPEYNFNTEQINKSDLYKKYGYIWDNYFKDILKPGRQPFFYFLDVLKDEETIEKTYFNTEINKIKSIIELDRKKYG